MSTNWTAEALLTVVFTTGLQATAMPVVRPTMDDDQVQNVALVTPESRVKRTTGTLGYLEDTQGRIWCFSKSKLPPTNSPTESYAKKNWYSIANASLAFEGNIVLLNKHAFFDDHDKIETPPENCFFEHLATGEFIRGTKDLAYPFVRETLEHRDLNRTENDVALWRIERAPSKPDLTVLREKDLLIDWEPPYYTPLIVVSNYAENAPKDKFDKTVTNCFARHPMVDKHGFLAYEFKSDCNTGKGSSGSLVFTDDGGPRKLVGMVRGESTRKKPGSGYDVDKLQTSIVRFQKNILDLYDQLKKLSQTSER